MYKIAIVGGFGLENFGDDWLLSEAIKLLSDIWKSKDLVIVAPNSNFPGDQFAGVDVVQDVNDCFVHLEYLLEALNSIFMTTRLPRQSATPLRGRANTRLSPLDSIVF